MEQFDDLPFSYYNGSQRKWNAYISNKSTVLEKEQILNIVNYKSTPLLNTAKLYIYIYPIKMKNPNDTPKGDEEPIIGSVSIS